MDHPRTPIRRAILAHLKTLRRVRGRVFLDRAEAFAHQRNSGELPALCLYSSGETPSKSKEAPKEYRRAFRLGVEVIVPRRPARSQLALPGDPVNEPEAALVDRLCKEVEGVLLSNRRLGGLVRELVYVRTRFDYTAEGETPLGSALVEFDAVYYTAHRERKAITATDFLRAYLEWSPVRPATTLPLRDVVNVRG